MPPHSVCIYTKVITTTSYSKSDFQRHQILMQTKFRPWLKWIPISTYFLWSLTDSEWNASSLTLEEVGELDVIDDDSKSSFSGLKGSIEEKKSKSILLNVQICTKLQNEVQSQFVFWKILRSRVHCARRFGLIPSIVL